MNQAKDKKFYSYFCFDKQSKYGSVRGKIFSLKTSTYTDKDGKEAKRLNFALACNNIDKKAKYVLDVEPVVSNKNPETIFIDCVAFWANAERLEKFLQQKDDVLLTGFLSHYEGNSGIRLNLRIQDALVIKRFGEVNRVQDAMQPATEPFDNSEVEDDDEIPF